MTKWQLIVRPKIYEDESIEGFIVRLSQMNGYGDIDNHLKLPFHFKTVLKEIKNSKIFRTHDYIYYDLAEVLTGHEIVDNRQRDRKFLSSKELLLGHGYRWYPCTTRYCPSCLVESLYHRIQWSMIPVIICEKHRCFLEFKCKVCDRPIDLKATVTGECSHCRNNLLLQTPNLISNDMLDRHLLVTGNNYFSDKVVYLNLNSQEIFRFKKWLIYCVVLSLQNGDHLDIRYSKNSNMVSIIEKDLELINKYIIISELIISDWPNNLLKYLEWTMNHEEKETFLSVFFRSKHNGKMRIFNFLNRVNINII